MEKVTDELIDGLIRKLIPVGFEQFLQEAVDFDLTVMTKLELTQQAEFQDSVDRMVRTKFVTGADTGIQGRSWTVWTNLHNRLSFLILRNMMSYKAEITQGRPHMHSCHVSGPQPAQSGTSNTACHRSLTWVRVFGNIPIMGTDTEILLFTAASLLSVLSALRWSA